MTPYSLHIYYDDTGGNRLPFPDVKEPAVLRKWKYSVERQQDSVPTVEATLMHSRCLEDEWNTLRPYIVLDNGERLDADRIFPDSQKSNEDARFSHTLLFVSQRARLKNILFFDAVTTQAENDRYASNSTDFVFSGTLREFVDRLEASLVFNGISDFSFVIDRGVDSSKTAEVSFSDAYMTEAIGHILSDFNTNYYWVGNTCHIGDCQNDIETPLEYGIGKGLLIVKKSNTDERPVNAVTGFGGSTNIPFYYPNEEEYGKTYYNVKNALASDIDIDWRKVYSNTGTNISALILAKKTASTRDLYLNTDFFGSNVCTEWQNYDAEDGSGMVSEGYLTTCVVTLERSINIIGQVGAYLDFRSALNFKPDAFCMTKDGRTIEAPSTFNSKQLYVTRGGNITNLSLSGQAVSVNLDYSDLTTVTFKLSYNVRFFYSNAADAPDSFFLRYSSPAPARLYSGSDSNRLWLIGEKFYNYSPLGISLPDSYTNYADFHAEVSDNGLQGAERIFSFPVTEQSGTKATAVTINVTGRDYTPPTGKLVPSIFRETNGEERFYYAVNHADDDSCTDKTSAQHTAFNTDKGFLSFDNVYSTESAVQSVQTFEDIVPTIKNVTNAAGQKIAEIVDVAFDDDDNDNKDADDKYLHPYFYIRLRVFDGSMGFSLFDHALQGEEAKICMTSSNGCPTCQFTIQALYDADGKAYNPVLVDSNGDILKGDYTNRLTKSWQTCSESNQDTSLHSVWIAVAKEETTLGTIMPSAAANLRPVAGDTFVITGISFPLTYIRAAERALDKALVDYMAERNSGTFEYDVTLSRIFLQDNPEITALINENSRLWLSYNKKAVRLYISAFSVSVDDNALTNIAISLSSEFKAYESRIDKAISSAVASSKSDILSQQKSKERTTPAMTRASAIRQTEETISGDFLTMETASENFLAIAAFSDLFEKVVIKEAVAEETDNDGNVITPAQPAVYGIRANYDFFSVKNISAFGFSNSEGSGSGSSVDVTQILHEGVHIATINGVEIYAPGGGGASSWAELTGTPPAVSTFTNDAEYITSSALSGYVKSSSLGSLAYLSMVGTENIAKHAVTEDKIAGGAVTAYQLADAAVQTAKIADKAITTAKITDGAITAAKIADVAVTTAKIADGAVTAAKIAAGAIDNGKLQHSSMTLWGAEVALGASYDGDIFLGTNSGLRLTDGTHTAWLKYDSANNAVYVADDKGNAVNLYSTGSVSAYGFSESAGGGGSVDVTQILSSGVHIATIAGVNIYAPEGGASSWADITGKPSWLETKPPVSAFTNDAGYITAAGQLWQDNGGTYQITGVNSFRFDDADVYMTGVVEIEGSLNVTETSTFNNSVYIGGSGYNSSKYLWFAYRGIFFEGEGSTSGNPWYGTLCTHDAYTLKSINLRCFNGWTQISQLAVGGDFLSGATSPSYTLDVLGTVRASTSLKTGDCYANYLVLSNNDGTYDYGHIVTPSWNSRITMTDENDGTISLACGRVDYLYMNAKDGFIRSLKELYITHDNGLHIGNAYLRWDSTNNALYVTGASGAQVNFYATGNVAGYSGLDGSVSELSNLDITGQLTAASINVDTIESAGTLQLNSGSGCDIVLNGIATVDPDGWIVAPYLAANNRLHVEQGGKLSIGSTAADHGITDVYADGSYVYITINGKRYRFTPSSTTAV